MFDMTPQIDLDDEPLNTVTNAFGLSLEENILSCDLLIDPSIEETSIGRLKGKVKNYLNFMIDTNHIAPSKVFVAATFRIDTILAVLASHPGCGGLRIYLAKQSDADSAADMTFILVPVDHGENEGDVGNGEKRKMFFDLIGNPAPNNGTVAEHECPRPLCPMDYEGSKLLPKGYNPHG